LIPPPDRVRYRQQGATASPVGRPHLLSSHLLCAPMPAANAAYVAPNAINLNRVESRTPSFAAPTHGSISGPRAGYDRSLNSLNHSVATQSMMPIIAHAAFVPRVYSFRNDGGSPARMRHNR
jgi:hypothetical protein